MITELIVQPPQPTAGAQIKCHVYNLKNFRLHKMLQTVSRTLLWMLEADSNNAASTVIARDSRNVKLALDNIEAEWNRAKKYRDAPMGTLEKGYEINLPYPSEIQMMRNVKLQAAALELYNFAHVVALNDSAQLQQWVGEAMTEDGDLAISILKEVVTETLGTGGKDESSVVGHDVGMQAPDYSRLGQLVPDVDNDVANLAEPSSENEPPAVPDTPDTPSKAPEQLK